MSPQVSPDGLLLQSSTVSDKVRYTFCGGATEDIAGSYVEFAERRPLKVRGDLSLLCVYVWVWVGVGVWWDAVVLGLFSWRLLEC